MGLLMLFYLFLRMYDLTAVVDSTAETGKKRQYSFHLPFSPFPPRFPKNPSVTVAGYLAYKTML